MEPVGPPGIGTFKLRIEVTETVNQTGRENDIKFSTFFIGKTGMSAIGLRIFQIDFPMVRFPGKCFFR